MVARPDSAPLASAVGHFAFILAALWQPHWPLTQCLYLMGMKLNFKTFLCLTMMDCFPVWYVAAYEVSSSLGPKQIRQESKNSTYKMHV